MAPKVLLFVVAILLLVSTKVSSNDNDEEYSTRVLTEKPSVPISVPAPAPAVPVKAPTPAPLVKPPAPQVPTPAPLVRPPAPQVPTPAPIVRPPPPLVRPPAPQVPTPAPIVRPPPPQVPTPPHPVNPPTKPIPKIRTIADCVPLCGQRCSAHSRPNVCKRACQTCCVRCKCVPPGTYGNREMCGTCYTAMMSRNRPKCP